MCGWFRHRNSNPIVSNNPSWKRTSNNRVVTRYVLLPAIYRLQDLKVINFRKIYRYIFIKFVTMILAQQDFPTPESPKIKIFSTLFFLFAIKKRCFIWRMKHIILTKCIDLDKENIFSLISNSSALTVTILMKKSAWKLWKQDSSPGKSLTISICPMS